MSSIYYPVGCTHCDCDVSENSYYCCFCAAPLVVQAGLFDEDNAKKMCSKKRKAS
jgi:hypothetical protein